MSLPGPTALANILLKRYECLRALVDHPQAKRDLVETIDIPRSTLDDVVRELEQAGLVEYIDGQWHPTHPGRSACRVHRDYLNQLVSLADASPVLEAMPTDTDVSWEFINGADIYETHPHIPDAVMTTLLDYVEAATDVRIVTPNVIAGHGAQFYQSGTSGTDSTLEMIVPLEIHEWLHSMYPTGVTEVLNDPDVNVFHAPIPFSFGLSIFDDHRAGVTVFTEQGIAGLLINDTDNALTWAGKQYERVKQEATPIVRHI